MEETTNDQADIARLTAEIVAAYVQNNTVGVDEVGDVIRTVAGELHGAGQTPAAPDKPEPVVPVRRSVQPEHLTCLVCGHKQRMLKRHLTVAHGLTPDEYRTMFGLKSDYPMIAPAYSEQRSALAIKIGLGRNPPSAPEKPARRRKAKGT